MGYADAVMSTAAGAAVFASVTAAVSTVLSSVLESSLLVAIPAGIGFGMATMTAVYVGLAARVGTRQYTASLAMGGLGVTFLAVLAAGVATGFPLSNGLLIALGAGALAAVGVAVGSSL